MRMWLFYKLTWLIYSWTPRWWDNIIDHIRYEWLWRDDDGGNR